MCSNNLREGAFDSYAVDPNNPHSPEAGFYIADGGDPSAFGLLLPAVQRAIDLPGESMLPMEQIRLATDGFDLMA